MRLPAAAGRRASSRPRPCAVAPQCWRGTGRSFSSRKSSSTWRRRSTGSRSAPLPPAPGCPLPTLTRRRTGGAPTTGWHAGGAQEAGERHRQGAGGAMPRPAHPARRGPHRSLCPLRRTSSGKQTSCWSALGRGAGPSRRSARTPTMCAPLRPPAAAGAGLRGADSFCRNSVVAERAEPESRADGYGGGSERHPGPHERVARGPAAGRQGGT